MNKVYKRVVLYGIPNGSWSEQLGEHDTHFVEFCVSPENKFTGYDMKAKPLSELLC